MNDHAQALQRLREDDMTLRCKPGDIALVIRAEHLHNIGLIVRVLRPYTGGDIELPDKGFLWEVDCRQLQMWMLNGSVLWRHCGPVPDDYLLPIRGSRDAHHALDKARRAQLHPRPAPQAQKR
jgi:hypothetical protein